jgi:hypothetical protein
MAVKLLLLKSNEEVVADVQELVDENEKPVFIVLTNPFIVKLIENPELLVEGLSSDNKNRYSVKFYQWMPLSAENRIAIDPSWVVTAVEPLDAVKQSYKEKMDGLE